MKKHNRLILVGTILATGLCLSLSFNSEAAPYSNPLIGAPDEQTHPYQKFSFDIHNDKKPESIALVAYNHSQNGYLGQLVFFDENDEVIWAGPRAKYASGQAFRRLDPQIIMENALIFGKVDNLNYEIKYVIDPDKDGNILVVLGETPIGVQISSFRVLRWNGTEFTCLRKDCRLIEDPMTPDHYIWSDKPLHSYNSGYSDGRWVRDLRLTSKPNVLNAIIREVKHPFSGPDRSPRFRRGEAEMEPEPTGTKLVRWDHPLQKWYKID
ncbi:MAG: hypothetical protein ACI38Q_08305 [Candidatus Bruticola sp.]